MELIKNSSNINGMHMRAMRRGTTDKMMGRADQSLY